MFYIWKSWEIKLMIIIQVDILYIQGDAEESERTVQFQIC
jgi:hypothetical protein